MTRMKGLWLVEESVQRFKNAWLELSEDKVVRPDGKPGTFATVRMKPGVSVLAMNDLAQVYLTSEYRYAVERESIEVVSGGIDEDEPPHVAARRELREELGIEAAQWINLGLVDPFTSVIHSPATLFLARKLSLVRPEPEGAELIKVLKLELREAVQMVLKSEITHGPSCIVILKTYLLLNSEKADILR
ncbi:MAG TPA: NUDIX hydrolase [Pyrinomonadaceae bacterium]